MPSHILVLLLLMPLQANKEVQMAFQSVARPSTGSNQYINNNKYLQLFTVFCSVNVKGGTKVSDNLRVTRI